MAHRLLIEDLAEWLFEVGVTVDWEKLLAYLPTFESADFSIEELEELPAVPFASAYEPSPEVDGFRETLHTAGVLYSFDWGSWEEAERLIHDPEALAEADELTLRRLLILHARKDRGLEDHLYEMVRSGHITAILRRLRTLRSESGSRSARVDGSERQSQA